LVVLVALGSFQCDQLLLGPEEQQVSYDENVSVPLLKGDGLRVSSPEEQNVDGVALGQVVETIMNNNAGHIHSMLIIRNNRLIHESYYDGWNAKRRHDLRSATKSFTSCIVGIAIDKGILPGVNVPVYDYFGGQMAFANPDQRKARMMIRHFLQMRTGLECNDSFTASQGNEEKMYKTDDWTRFILDLPAVEEPGSEFSYCTGAPVVLGNLISKASGRAVPDFADEFLFAPLGITDYQWEYTPTGNADTGGHLHLYPRDMAKFGMLFLNGGDWEGTRVVSSQWVTQSTRNLNASASPTEGYGYLWWTSQVASGGRLVGHYRADGNGGQMIIVIPQFNAVIVFTGGNFNARSSPISGLLISHIYPAFK
jgi:CubicO group peptidase (beta-lactamase class C family)